MAPKRKKSATYNYRPDKKRCADLPDPKVVDVKSDTKPNVQPSAQANVIVEAKDGNIDSKITIDETDEKTSLSEQLSTLGNEPEQVQVAALKLLKAFYAAGAKPPLNQKTGELISKISARVVAQAAALLSFGHTV